MGQIRKSLPTDSEREERKKARMERNRVSAARHRQSQRDLIASLQTRLDAALAENDRLKQGLVPPNYTLVKIGDGPDAAAADEAAAFTL